MILGICQMFERYCVVRGRSAVAVGVSRQTMRRATMARIENATTIWSFPFVLFTTRSATIGLDRSVRGRGTDENVVRATDQRHSAITQVERSARGRRTTMTPREMHVAALTRIRRQLHNLFPRSSITRLRYREIGDFLLGKKRIAVRVGSWRPRRQIVIVDGKRYEYDIHAVVFNLHVHGRWPDPLPDFWLLICGPRVWVLPSKAWRGKTVQIQSSTRKGWTKLRQFEGAWGLLKGAT